MDLNKKFAKALENALELKGITVVNPKNLEIIAKLDEKSDDFEVGVHCNYIDSNSFLYTILDMIQNEQVELKFNLDKEDTTSNLNYLKELDIK